MGRAEQSSTGEQRLLFILILPIPHPNNQGACWPPVHLQGVGTLKDGYVRNVPLPRAPRIQHGSHASRTCDTCYLVVGQVPRIPTWSDLTRLLAGLGRSILKPFSLSLA
jgi:hypothetical protein